MKRFRFLCNENLNVTWTDKMLSFWTDAIYELMYKIVTRMLLRPILAYKKRTSLVFDLQVVEVGSPLTFYLPLLCLLFFLFYLHVLFTFHIVLFVFFSCSNRRESWPWSNITIARRRSPDCKSRWDLSVDKGHFHYIGRDLEWKTKE